MHVVDKIEWHKQIENLETRYSIQAITNFKKIKGMVMKLESQLK
jgi:hypothetical protein